MWNRFPGLVATAILVALLSVSNRLSGAPPSREAELQELRREIAELEDRLGELGDERADLESELERTELALELQEKRLAQARAERSRTENQLESLGEDIVRLEVELAEIREALRARLLELYRMGRHGYLRMFLSIGSDDQLVDGIRQLRFFVHRDTDLLARYSAARDRLQAEQGRLLELTQVLKEWVRQEFVRVEELAEIEGRLAGLLKDLERRTTILAEEASSLEAIERKLSGFLDYLYGRLDEPSGGISLQEFRGVLDWPVEGRVVTEFGPRSEPRYQTQVPHNGVEMETAADAEVRSVFQGTVLFADQFQGYGLTVIVHHPGRVFSLYAGLASLRVAAGDVVSFGQSVGSTDGRIYFEVREENRPVDPRDWVR